MKILILKTNRILMLFCILMLTVLSFSCSKDKDDDDDNNKTSTSLIGKWKWEQIFNNGENGEGGDIWLEVVVLNFIDASEGTFSYDAYKDGHLHVEEESIREDFTYSTKSGILTMSNLGEMRYTVKNSTLTLIFEADEYSEEETMVFTKM